MLRILATVFCHYSTQLLKTIVSYFNLYVIFLSYRQLKNKCLFNQQVHINEICAANKIKFYTADVFGFYGHMFVDLGHHKYVE